MKILLVNSNPVVSRLTSLSARKESVKVDEIKDISEVKKSNYDIVFVDFESYTKELSNFFDSSKIQKRVLFYTQDDKETPDIFNITILKPFLPSEVSAVLRERKIEIEESSAEEPKEEYINLNELIAEKKDDLAPINLLDEKKDELELEPVSPIENEVKKPKKEIESIKLVDDEKIVETIEPKIEKKIEEQIDIELEPISLIDDDKTVESKKPKKEKIEEKKEELVLEPIGLMDEKITESKKPEIEKELEPISLIEDNSSEEKLLSELNQSKSKIDNIEKSPNLDIAKKLPIEETKDDSKLFELDIEDNKKSSSDTSGLFEMDSNDFKDEILDLDIDSKNEVDFDAPPKEEKSTKILDKDEISNIKTLLDSDKEVDKDISLEDVMTTTAPQVYTKVEKKVKKRKKKKSKKEIENKKLSSEIITDTLSALPIDDLRRLLLGTKIHITIEFPKEF